MKRILAVVAIIAIAVFSSCALPLSLVHAAEPDLSAPRAQVKVLTSGSGFCSAVVIAPGALLSAGHCASGESKWMVNGKPVTNIRYVSDGGGKDIALMAADVSCPCAKFADFPPNLDEPVAVVGFPMYRTVKTQIVYRARSMGPDHEDALLLDILTAPGNSGGGVYVYRDGEWQLAGVLVAGLRNWAVSSATNIAYIKAFLETD